MATTSGNLAAGAARIGGSGDTGTGGRFGLRALVAAGVATLGCAAALAVGGLGAGTTARPQPQDPPGAAAIRMAASEQREHLVFLEQNQLPELTGVVAATTYERQRFLEQNELPVAAPAATATTSERLVFLEQNQLPGDTTPTTALDDPRSMPR